MLPTFSGFRHKNMKNLILTLLFVLPITFLSAQIYDDYIGAGHSQGISIQTSDNLQISGWEQSAVGENTLNTNGLEGKLMEASRFLAQATFGADWETIQEVAQMGIEEWIDQQMEVAPTYILPEMIEVYNTALQIYVDNGGNPANYNDRPEWDHFDYAWWQVNMTSEDLLRQRIAFALSEILVVSVNSGLSNYGEGLGDYYDIFIRNAFGNYLDILTEVTLHPSMGVYLSHLNNPKAVPEDNIHPDENYAREVMQLFSIGLFELNLDGSRKTDADGNFIPTYTNDDIKEFAKVYTGLGAGGLIIQNDEILPTFGRGPNTIDFTVPMAMYEDWHETEEKHLLNGYIIPAGQDGMTDVRQAIEHLFNHPNVGPFIGRLLIQRLVKSNPSPEYIARVAAAFNDNGAGIRGDMAAVIKAILLDEEARSCEWVNHPNQGRLREPITRYTQFAKAIGARNQYGLYWNIGRPFQEDVGQHPLHSPSVFNFYLPDFQPNGPIAAQGLVGPEFQIHNARTSVGYVNAVNSWAVDDYLFETWESNSFFSETDYSGLLEFAKDPDVLINKLDVLLTNGQLTEDTRQIIKTAITPFSNNTVGDYNRLRLAAYLFMISPDYNVLK